MPVIPASALAVVASVHERLQRHLFPGDGLEAAAILLCSQTPGPRHKLLARDVLLVPHEACSRREKDVITWPGVAIEEAIDRAEAAGLSLVLTHSHPGSLFAFSRADDLSDQRVMPGIFQALNGVHGSAIMIPGGAMLARTYQPDMSVVPLDLVTMAGHDLHYWWRDAAFSMRPMAFTAETRDELSRLTACVIGVSGTGSIVAEQLARIGFGRVFLIDFDHVEDRNLNRILNATLADAERQVPKVESMAVAITLYRGPNVAIPLVASISTREAVLLASQADALFSCTDTLESRNYADLVASAFFIPLFDVGVTIPTRETASGAAIADVLGRIDYVQPGGPTLLDRGVYDPASLRAEYLRRANPEAYQNELGAGYFKGVVEQAPSVITLNMRAASACAMEFLARAYPFRHETNARYARTTFSLASTEEEFFAEDAFEAGALGPVGRGAEEPLLGLPSLSAEPT